MARMSLVKTRTISSVTETAVQLSGSYWARPVKFPTGWTSVRMGIRAHMTDTGAALLDGCTFAMGFCVGNTNVPGATATPTHFAGLWVTSAGWGRNSTTYHSSSNEGFGTISYATNVSGTLTTLNPTNSGSQAMYFGNGADSAIADRVIAMIDITKGSVISGTNFNYAFRLYSLTNSSSLVDQSKSNLTTQMLATTPSATNYFYYTSQNLAIDRTVNGEFDSVCMWFKRSDVIMEICDVQFVKLA